MISKLTSEEKELKKALLLAGCNYRYGCDVDMVAKQLMKMGYVRIEQKHECSTLKNNN